MPKQDPIVHFEIPADKVERAQKFYTKTFGWKIEKFDMPDTGSTSGDPYYMIFATETNKKGMAKIPGTINGGLMKRKAKGQPFMNYIAVKSITTKLKTIKKNGGKILMPKTLIGPGMGWIACFKDTEGNMVGLHQAPPEAKKKKK